MQPYLAFTFSTAIMNLLNIVEIIVLNIGYVRNLFAKG